MSGVRPDLDRTRQSHHRGTFLHLDHPCCKNGSTEDGGEGEELAGPASHSNAERTVLAGMYKRGVIHAPNLALKRWMNPEVVVEIKFDLPINFLVLNSYEQLFVFLYIEKYPLVHVACINVSGILGSQ